MKKSQPCFDMYNGKLCLQQKKIPPCMYSHDAKILTAFAAERHIKSNANPFLPTRLHDPKMEKPLPPKPTLPPPRLHLVQGNSPVVLPDSSVRPGHLKPSMSSRPDLSSYSYNDGEYEEQFEQKEDPD